MQDISHSYVSDDGIRTATIMLPKLVSIELSSCRYVTAKTVGILETTSDGMGQRMKKEKKKGRGRARGASKRKTSRIYFESDFDDY